MSEKEKNTQEEVVATENAPETGQLLGQEIEPATEEEAPSEEKKTKSKSKKQSKTVEVDAGDLQAVIARQDQLEQTNKKQAEEIAILKGTVANQRLKQSERDLEIGVDKRIQFKLKRMPNGKVIRSWKGLTESQALSQNGVLHQGQTPVGEIVKAHVVYIDGSDEIIDYSVLTQCNDIVFCRINSQKLVGAPDNQTLVFVAEFEDPRLHDQYGEFEIEQTFVNP